MKFDVFVSFRGDDTRRAFVSHLLLSLSKKQITVYRDAGEIPRSQSVYSQVLQAIKVSKIAIVVISKNYAASSWCLEELAMIFECKEKGSFEVVPVFYEVDPSDVLRQVEDRDNNLETMKNLEKLIEIYHQKYSYWEDEDSYSYIIDQVLIHVSRLLETPIENETEPIYPPVKPAQSPKPPAPPLPEPSAEPKPPEYFPVDSEMPNTFLLILQLLYAIVTKGFELVAAAFRMISGRFMHGEKPSGVKPIPPIRLLDVQNKNYVIGNNLSRLVLSNNFNRFVGMDRLMKEVKALLDLESREAILQIGIYGKRGVGKSTLARCVYEELSPQFQDHHYFTNETIKCYPGACLLDNIARTSLTEQSESFQEFVKVMLGHRKVLLIVDNISTGGQSERIRNIARWFGPGSRLIMVTQPKHLLHGMERRYAVEPLRYDEALQLFSQSAFKREQVPREHYKLSVRALTITGRIPLALKVFGTFLCGKHISEWENELCRLETPESTWDCVAKVSSYIGRALS